MADWLFTWKGILPGAVILVGVVGVGIAFRDDTGIVDRDPPELMLIQERPQKVIDIAANRPATRHFSPPGRYTGPVWRVLNTALAGQTLGRRGSWVIDRVHHREQFGAVKSSVKFVQRAR